jgi:hypothetical protein
MMLVAPIDRLTKSTASGVSRQCFVMKFAITLHGASMINFLQILDRQVSIPFITVEVRHTVYTPGG